MPGAGLNPCGANASLLSYMTLSRRQSACACRRISSPTRLRGWQRQGGRCCASCLTIQRFCYLDVTCRGCRLITPARSSGAWTTRWLFWSSATALVGSLAAAYNFVRLRVFITPVSWPLLSGHFDPVTLKPWWSVMLPGGTVFGRMSSSR